MSLRYRAGPEDDVDGHPAVSLVHVHAHTDVLRGGSHTHVHSHANDRDHVRHHAPGSPVPGAPGVQLAGSPPGGETRGGPGLEDIDLGAAIASYLKSEGVDVARAAAEAGYERGRKAARVSARADRAVDLARALRKAKRRTAVAQDAWRAGWPGSSWHEVCEMREAEAEAEAELREACGNDPELISEAKRRAAR